MTDVVDAHAPLSPSGAGVWAHCAGSVSLAAQFPEPITDETKEGNAAHWVAASILCQWKSEGGRSPLMHSEYLGSADPDGTIVTLEMLEGAEMYCDEIAEKIEGIERQGIATVWDRLQVEQRVYATERIHPDNWGTCDAWLYVPELPALMIWDFKFGFLDVPAFENMQLLNYYEAIAQGIGLDGLTDQQVCVEMYAIQPRCFTANGPIKTWFVKGSDLRGHANQLRTAAHAATAPNPSTTTGSHCRYCPARHVCQAAQKAAMAGVEYIATAVPDVLSGAGVSFEVATLRRAKADIEYRLEAMEEDAQSRITAGKTVPGFRVQRTAGRRKWTAEIEVIRNMGAMLGANLIADEKAKTPHQAELELKRKGLAKSAVDTMIAPLTAQPSSGTKLVADDGSEARRIFSQN